jgi:hypothetical protein
VNRQLTANRPAPKVPATSLSYGAGDYQGAEEQIDRASRGDDPKENSRRCGVHGRWPSAVERITHALRGTLLAAKR